MINRRRSRKRVTSEPARNSRAWVVFDWVVVIIFGLILLVGAISALVEPVTENLEQEKIPIPGDALIIQVFNGSGDVAAANAVTDSLRRLGLDVKDIVKDAGVIYPYSLLVDRRGDVAKSDTLIKIVGLPMNRVVLQRNNDMFDATLVLGRDYRIALAKLIEKDKTQ